MSLKIIGGFLMKIFKKMKNTIIIILLSLPIFTYSQTKNDSLKTLFALRDSVNELFENSRTIGNKNFNLNVAYEYADKLRFLNYYIKCIQKNETFKYENYMLSMSIKMVNFKGLYFEPKLYEAKKNE